MKKMIAILFMSLCLVTSITACGGTSDSKSSEEQAQEKDNDSDATDEIEDEEENEPEKEADISIDIEKCISDLKENLPLEPDYTFVRDYSIIADGDELTITAVVDDATDPEKALDFADTLIRQLNLYASMQDSDIKPSSADYYGGLYDEYSALVGVAQASKTDDPDEWLVYDSIATGKTMIELHD